MDIKRTDLDGVLLITPPTVFEDFRGSYVETYNEQLYTAAGIDTRFVQDDISTSTRGVLRGIHGDERTWKLISCLQGSFYLVVLNHDQSSPQFGRWQAFTLSDRNRLQVLVPPRHGNGHLVLTEQAIFSYKQSTQYDRASQFTVTWNDPRFQIYWPIRDPVLSARDAGVTGR
jgi:dTDP-4-dehydrorhamnose 3,5-epimerase